MESKKVTIMNRLSFISLIGTLFLSILFFVPYIPVTLEASKGFLVSIGVILSVLSWLTARLMDGKFTIPKDRLLFYIFLIPIVFLIASFFSESLYHSFFASGFEVGTFGSVLTLSVLFFLCSLHFQVENRIKKLFTLLFSGTLILGIFQIVYVFAGLDRLLPGMFSGVVSGNLIGTWNDFVLFYGAMVVLAVFTLEFLKLDKIQKIALYSIISIGLIFFMIVNVSLVWILVGIFSLFVFVYKISNKNVKVKNIGEDKLSTENKLPLSSVIVMVVSVLFIMGGNMFGGFISKYVTVSSSNIRPSAESTFQVAVQAIKHNPFFGTGPNTFAIDWTQWRPSTIKNTEFWNVEFSQGVGSIPTLLVTTGILGFASVILFIFIFLFRAFKYVRLAFSNINKNYFLFMSFLLSLYGWILLFVYTPNILLWTITFASSGVFIGILVNKKNISVYSLSFTNNSRISFFSMLTIVVLMIMSVFGLYVYTKKIISIVYFSKGVSSTNTTAESLLKSETLLLNAISLDKNDLYYRTISQVYVAELNFILNDKSLSEDIIKSRAQSTIENIQKSANEAVSISPKNYQNWVNRGNVYSSMVTMGVDKAYENAVESYDNAFIFAPSNPGILLARAQLEFLKKNNESAKKYIEQSLVMKNDYLDAIFTMAQIQASEGNLPAAIKQAEYAATLYPNDSSVFFRLGILRYDNGEFGNAVNSFEASVVLDPSNLNARYMLGTSYLRLGRTDDAKVQFEILNKYIPDNVEVKRELEKIRNSSLVESKKNVNLPVTEKN